MCGCPATGAGRRNKAMAPRLSVRRRAGSLVVILVVSSLALLPASPAWAARPDIVRIPGGSFSDILGQGQCAFPVRLDFVARQGLIQVFSNGDGAVRAVHLAGSLNGTFTRILDDGSDGPDLRLNFSGPGNIDPATGDLSGTGPWLLASPDDPNTPE